MDKKKHRILNSVKFLAIILLLFMVEENIYAQKFSIESFQKERVQGVNKKLAAVIKSKNESKILSYIQKNRNEINDGVQLKYNSKILKKKSLSQPFLWAVTDLYFEGVISFNGMKKILSLNPNLQLDFNGQNYFYYLLNRLAITKIAHSNKIKKLYRYLIDTGYDSNDRYQSLPPPLTALLYYNYEHLNGHMSNDYLANDVLKILIENGANINAVDKYGNSLLSFATALQRDQLLNYLVANGINLQKQNREKEDAFILALKTKNISNVESLIKGGYNLDLFYLFENKGRNLLKGSDEIKDFILSLALKKNLDLKQSEGFLGIFPESFNEWMKLYSQDKVYLNKDEYPVLISFIRHNDVHTENAQLDEVKIDYLHLSKNIDELFENSKKVKFNLDIDFIKDYWKSEVNSNKLLSRMEQSKYLLPSFKKEIGVELKSKTNKFYQSQLSSDKYWVIKKLNETFPSKREEIRVTLSEKMDDYKYLAKKNISFNWWTSGYDIFQIRSDYVRIRSEVTDFINYYNNSSYSDIITGANRNIAIIDNTLQKRRAEREAFDRRFKQDQCNKCRINSSKTTFPSKDRNFIWTVDNPGEIVMENGEKYEFYYDGDDYSLRDGVLFFSSTTFDKFDKMLNYFLKTCEDHYCN